MSNLNVVEFPQGNVSSVADGLRRLADDIDAGKFDGAHNLVWAIDRGDANIDVGLLGSAAESAPVAYYLLGLGMHKLVSIINGTAP